MRPRRVSSVVLTALVSLAVLVGSPGPATAAASPPAGPSYYVALGDSLSQGYMPGRGDTDEGYVDALYATLAAQRPGLELVKLGCSGETTATMVQGGICAYDGAASQLEAAKAFLQAHRGEVAYVTIDIGANDVARCAAGATIDQVCARDGLATVARNLPTIARTLRQAGGSTPTYAGMTYYDPFLAAWLLGEAGQATARESVVLTNRLNVVEAVTYVVKGFRVARVAAAFHTNDFATQETLPNGLTVPRNVATICALTYMCEVFDIHAKVDGYRLIAATFAEVLLPRRG